MKASLLIFSILGILLITSCNKSKIESGEIEYEISYPYSQISGLTEMMLPKKMTVIFKDSKMMATIKKGKMFNTSIISDEVDQSLEMRLGFGSDFLNTFLTTNDIDELVSSQPLYTFSKPKTGDSLVGCTTNNYVVDCKLDTLDAFSSVFTEDFTTQNAAWFTSYSSIKGMPLVYLIDRYGIVMHVKATKFTPREVLDTEFDPKTEFEEVSYGKYEYKVQELFNVLME